MNFRNVVFLLYDSRSGSTWLSSILHGYRNVHVLKECTIVSRIMKAPPIIDSGVLSDIIADLKKDKQNEEMGLDISYLVKKSYSSECSPLEFVGQIIESIRAELAIDDNVYLVVKDQLFSSSRKLAGHFCEAEFVCLVRDGWEVFLSKRNTIAIDGLPMTQSVITSALRWNYFANRTLELSRLNAPVTVLHYHQLKGGGRTYLEENISFLESDYDDEARIKYATDIGESQKGLHRNLLKAGARSSYTGTAAELHLYRVLTSGSARALGYTPDWERVNLFRLVVCFFMDCWKYMIHRLQSRRELKL